MERRPLPATSRGKKPTRLKGEVRIYLRDQGIGYIRCGERELRFGVTDFVGCEQPQEGDPVSFVAQLQGEQWRARLIRIEQTAQSLDHSPASPRLAREVRPESAETVRAAKVRASVHQYHPKARDHVRCGGCRRLVIPKMVKVKSGALRGSAPRWVESCPRCKGSLDGKASSLKMIWGATAAMIGGAVVVTRGFFF